MNWLTLSADEVDNFTDYQALGQTGQRTVTDRHTLIDDFLRDVQARALRIAQLSLGNTDDALDAVQDAMFKLVEKYLDKPQDQWAPLFYRILHSRINDLHRRSTVRNRFRIWLGSGGEQTEDELREDPIQNAADPSGLNPERETANAASIAELELALAALPQRQQQAFLLRVWEGLDVKQTALAMNCAEGSVKTHFSRAVHSLRASLGDHWQ